MAKIAIVDDSPAIRTELKKALEGAGHSVVEGENGTDGLAKITGDKEIKLIITDYNMPGLDGIKMLEKIKETMGSMPVPVFMLTTETSDTLKAAGKQVGVIAWINKPFVADKLLGAIGKVVK